MNSNQLIAFLIQDWLARKKLNISELWHCKLSFTKFNLLNLLIITTKHS